MAERKQSPLKTKEFEPASCGVELRLEILSRVPFFAGLPPAAIAAINRRFREQGFEPEETIYYSGDPAIRLYVVAAGKIKLLRHSPSGQDVLLDILAPGEFFGSLAALGDDHYPATAVAQTTVCVLGIDADDFRAILSQYPPVALAVLDVTAGRLQAAQDAIHQLSTQPAEQRIAATLLKLAQKLGEPAAPGLLIQMPLSRDNVANMAGTTTETASRVLSHFQKDGLIRSGRQWIAITDLDALTALLNESPTFS